MEFLEGEVLADRMERRGPLPFAEALVVMRQVASILETAHARNVVHRDLKPANVMMVADPEAEGGERAKLLDFGLAKLLSDMTESGTTGTHLHTRTGLTMGTPVYMAPEQCRGERDVSGQVDVYALGVMFYEMLTGKPPFQAKSGGELMSMHLRDEPPSLRAAAPQVPLAVTDLVHSMLRKDAAERPTMAQVVELLASVGPEPVVAIVAADVLIDDFSPE
jgi:serine/threonine-protein kinase